MICPPPFFPRLSLCGVIDEGAEPFQDKQTRKHTNSFPPELISSGPPRRARPAHHTQKIPLKEQLKSHDHELDDDSPADRPSLMLLDIGLPPTEKSTDSGRPAAAADGEVSFSKHSRLFLRRLPTRWRYSRTCFSFALLRSSHRKSSGCHRAAAATGFFDPEPAEQKNLFVGFISKKYNKNLQMQKECDESHGAMIPQ